MHPSLERELARIGRAWGALNDYWLAKKRDYSHGSPAFKWSGANPCGADSARNRALQFGSNTSIGSPLRDRTTERRKDAASCSLPNERSVGATEQPRVDDSDVDPLGYGGDPTP